VKRHQKKVWDALREAGLYDFHHAFMALTLLKFNGLDAALVFIDQCARTPKQQPLFPDNIPTT
jgi:hypothetical protein